MKFTRKEFGEVHIEMRFVRGGNNHSDGPGGMGGSAYYPLAGADVFLMTKKTGVWILLSLTSVLSPMRQTC